jgi:hypothetical protein
MDYIASMSKEKEAFSFSEMYETAIQKKEYIYDINPELAKKLQDKRNFGLKKYGEYSFQGNLENCMTAPTLLHAQEEMVDCINYLLHEMYKNDLRGDSNDKLKVMITGAIKLYIDLEYLLQHK